MAGKKQKLWERFDLLYARRRQWPYNWLRGLSLLLALGVGGLVAYCTLRDDHRVHSPGPLSRAHAMFEKDCARCHQPTVEGSRYWLPVTDDACLACHNAAAHPDPHRRLFAGPTLALSDRLGGERMAGQCVQCHMEHGGEDANLKRVSDEQCNQCHVDLAAYALTSGGTSAAGTANSVTSFMDAHPPFAATSRNVIDQTRLEFGHQAHMDPAYYPKMRDKLAAWVSSQQGAGVPDRDIPVGGGGGKLSLTCGACHTPDAAGKYMQPIVFEQHCAHCHPLGERDGESVPHGLEVEAFLSRAAVKQTLEPPKKPATTGPRRGPKRSSDSADEPAAMTLEQFQQRIREAGEALVPPVLGRCKQCHGPVEGFGKIVDPAIPDRWMPRSVFDHAAHRTLDCLQCHPQAGAAAEAEVAYPGEDDPESAAHALRWTGRTRDAMLPDIDSCRQCHGPAHAESAGVRHTCVTCHVFHGGETDVTRLGPPARPLSIADMLHNDADDGDE